MFLLFIVLLALSAQAQKTDNKLTKLIEKEVNGFHGIAGIYVKNLKTGREAA